MKKNRMSYLIKKIKRSNKLLSNILFITNISYLLGIGFLIYSIILLSGIETLIRISIIVLLIIYYIFYTCIGTFMILTNKFKSFMLLSILTLIFTGLNVFAFYYIQKTYNIVDEISKDKIIYTTNLVTKADYGNEIKKVGLISNENDIEGYILPQEYIVINDKKYEIKYYQDYLELLNDLYNEKIDAVFVGANYVLKFGEIEKYENIAKETKVVDAYSKKMDNQDAVISTGKDITEPFTLLLLGVDSEFDGLKNNAEFNGDSIMLITFNPKTLSAVVFSIPRDTYVPIACNNNKEYKINSAAASGTKCMIDTIQNLIDIPIDYYLKINFKGVVSLVDTLGGITLDVEKPDFKKNLGVDCQGKICEQNSNREFGDKIVYIDYGTNVTLNGEQALAYARNRHQWALSDFKRIEHQQAVVNAIVNKTKSIRNINTLYNLLTAISNNIDTNISTKQILNFYNVGKKALQDSNFAENEFINIQKTYLSGYDLNLYQNGYTVYTYQYYEESLNEIIRAMKVNLEIENAELIKTFNFSANDTYEVAIIGKKYLATKRNETMPNFKGKTTQYALDWLTTRNINLETSYIESNDCIDNTILSQDVHSDTLIKNISALKVNVCKNIIIENDQNE